ncbi:MAG TPA: extracellular solute-binding protein [Thermomicrobiales bacterium]|nr:extracellular solute-binding protein [Thermomicrobiales bacterium]
MVIDRPRAVTRRTFLGASIGVGGALLVGRAGAAPSSSGGPAILTRNADKVKLTMWGHFPEETDAFKAIVADFEKSNPDVTIDVQMTANDQWKAKINSALNAGSGPDIWMANSKPQMDIDVKTGLILDLTNDVDVSTLTDVAKDAVTVDNKIWAVPTGRYTVGICYHKDLFDKAGVTKEPTTWDEMKSVMEALKSKKITPYSIAVKDGSLSYFNYIGLASAALGDTGFKAILDGSKKLTDPDAVSALQEMRDWIPYYQPNYLGTVYAESKALFATKKTAMMDCGSADLSGYYQIDPNAQLGFFPWPSPDASKKQVTNTGMNVIFSVNAKLEGAKRDGAVAFMKWLLTPEGGNSVAQHNKVLPVVKGVEPAGDPVLTEMANSPLDIPVWYERWPTLNIGDVWTKGGNAGFDEKTPPEEFAAKLQASVDEQLKTPQT